jgi:alpha-beta hydrolase superfamily lysophospholipase
MTVSKTAPGVASSSTPVGQATPADLPEDALGTWTSNAVITAPRDVLEQQRASRVDTKAFAGVRPTTGFLERDGARLHFKEWLPASARGQVLFVPGYDDHLGRYDHVLQHLVEQGFAVRAYDPRGEGLSEGGPRGHVEKYGQYVDDLEAMRADFATKTGQPQMFFVTHSNGGLTATRWLETHDQRSVLGVASTGPFFAPAARPSAWVRGLARVTSWFNPAYGQPNPLLPDTLTRDAHFQQAASEDTLKHRQVTVGWYRATTGAQEAAELSAATITAPLLVFHGEADGISSPTVSRRVFDAAGSADKTFTSVPGARHEVFMELDRKNTLEQLTSWLGARLPASRR